jgi:hypothetical protein
MANRKQECVLIGAVRRFAFKKSTPPASTAGQWRAEHTTASMNSARIFFYHRNTNEAANMCTYVYTYRLLKDMLTNANETQRSGMQNRLATRLARAEETEKCKSH